MSATSASSTRRGGGPFGCFLRIARNANGFLPECELGLALFFRFDPWAEQLLVEALLHQLVDYAVVQDSAKIENLQLLRDIRVGRVIQGAVEVQMRRSV